MTSFPGGPPGICLNPCRLFPVSGNPYQPRPWACFMGLEAEAQRMARSQTICSRGSLVLGVSGPRGKAAPAPLCPCLAGWVLASPGLSLGPFPQLSHGAEAANFLSRESGRVPRGFCGSCPHFTGTNRGLWKSQCVTQWHPSH